MPIKNIDSTEVQRITSGQVIVDLVSVVKELVENAIDSGSTKIDVTFSDSGLDYIKIEDDGSGIEEEDFEYVCLRHHTSKLVLFEGLAQVSTLGFRGEAMSSICSVANLTISTCTKQNYPRISQLTFDNMGRLTGTEKSVGGLRGTVVTVTSLFNALPVRRKTLEKNIKREFQKAVNNLICYILIHPEIRFTVYNITAAKKKQMMLGTQGGSKADIKLCLLNVYGSNGTYGLELVSLEAKELEVKFKLNAGDLPVLKRLDIKFEGMISNCSFGMGRSAGDRQYIYLNKRPVESRRFIKTVNEVYRSFNTVQFPVVVLNIVLDGDFLDINVTPDKRTVMIHNEDVLNDVLRHELTKFYESEDTQIPVNNDSWKLPSQSIDRAKRKEYYEQPSSFKRYHLAEDEELDANDTRNTENELNDIGENVEEHKSQEEDEMEHNESYEEDSVIDREMIRNTNNVDEMENNESHEEDSINEKEMIEDTYNVDENEIQISDHDSPHPNITRATDDEPTTLFVDDDDNFTAEQEATAEQEVADQVTADQVTEDPREVRVVKLSDFVHSDGTSEVVASDSEKELDDNISISIGNRNFLESPKKQSPKKKHNVHDVRKVLSFDINGIGSNILNNDHQNSLQAGKKIHIDNIEAREEAEKKLVYLISKKDFTKMQVVGQFNLGFILVTLNGGNNLFIVDQHASDEKYNFERLANSTTMFHSQLLVVPRNMELNALDEMTVLANLEVFKTNGFGLKVDEDEAPGHRVKLTSLPVLRTTVFDESDFHELIHLTNQAGSINNKHVKCSKIRTILALRSCRSSIMIGQPLSTSTMKKVVHNLSHLDKPWNCPHGRPTMRHLTELNEWHTFTKDYHLH